MQTTQQKQLESLIVFKDSKVLKPRNAGRNAVSLPSHPHRQLPTQANLVPPRRKFTAGDGQPQQPRSLHFYSRALWSTMLSLGVTGWLGAISSKSQKEQ